jgi:hypothetical protein
MPAHNLKQSFTAASLEAEFTGAMEFMAVDFTAVDFTAAMDIIAATDTGSAQQSSAAPPWARQ